MGCKTICIAGLIYLAVSISGIIVLDFTNRAYEQHNPMASEQSKQLILPQLLTHSDTLSSETLELGLIGIYAVPADIIYSLVFGHASGPTFYLTGGTIEYVDNIVPDVLIVFVYIALPLVWLFYLVWFCIKRVSGLRSRLGVLLVGVIYFLISGLIGSIYFFAMTFQNFNGFL